MKFFKNKKDLSSNEILSSKKSEEITFNVCFDYFGSFSNIGQSIIEDQRYVLNEVRKENLDNGLTYAQIDMRFNKELIKERAIKKYKVADEDLLLTDAEWFPRLRTIKFNEEDDNESISSYNSVSVSIKKCFIASGLITQD